MSFNDLAKKEESLKKDSDAAPPKPKAGTEESPAQDQKPTAQPKN